MMSFKVNIAGKNCISETHQEKIIWIVGQNMSLQKFNLDTHTIDETFLLQDCYEFISIINGQIYIGKSDFKKTELQQLNIDTDLMDYKTLISLDIPNCKFVTCNQDIILLTQDSLILYSVTNQSHFEIKIEYQKIKITQKEIIILQDSQIKIYQIDQNTQTLIEQFSIKININPQEIQLLENGYIENKSSENRLKYYDFQGNIYYLYQTHIKEITQICQNKYFIFIQTQDKLFIYDIEKKSYADELPMESIIQQSILKNGQIILLLLNGELKVIDFSDLVFQKRKRIIQGDDSESLQSTPQKSINYQEKQNEQPKISEFVLEPQPDQTFHKEEIKQENYNESQSIIHNDIAPPQEPQINTHEENTLTQFHFNSGYVDSNGLVTIMKQNIHGRIVYQEQLKQIEICYKDISIQAKKIIQNKLNYNLGDLNQIGYVLVYSGSEEHQNQIDAEENYIECQEICAKLYFQSTETDNEWSVYFNLTINIILVSMSSQFIGIGTNTDEIKVFNLGGTEVLNFQHPNQLVTLSCYENYLGICGLRGKPLNNRQSLNVSLFDLRSFKKISEQQLPISPGSFLTFFSLSEEGVFYVQDNIGNVFKNFGLDFWTKIYQNKKETSLWVYGVIDGNLIGYKIKPNQSVPDPSENYQTFKVVPRVYLNHQNTHDITEEKLVLSQIENSNNEIVYQLLRQLKEIDSDNIQLQMLQNQIKNEQEQLQSFLALEKNQLEYIRQLVDEGKQYQALYYLLQIQTKEHFEIGLKFFQKLGLNKLVKLAKKIGNERGVFPLPKKDSNKHKKEDHEDKNIKKEQLESYFKNQEEDNQETKFVKNFIEDFQKSESKAPQEQSRHYEENKNAFQQPKKFNNDLMNQLDGMVQQNHKRVN